MNLYLLLPHSTHEAHLKKSLINLFLCVQSAERHKAVEIQDLDEQDSKKETPWDTTRGPGFKTNDKSGVPYKYTMSKSSGINTGPASWRQQQFLHTSV